jgi:membrane protease YdiL (CAAX protease family)
MSTPVTTPPVPAGWYPDPWRQAWWRWWDGAGWTPFTEQWFGPQLEERKPGEVRAGGIAILGFLVGIGLSVAIALPLVVLGFDAEDPAVLLGSMIGLWTGMGGACVIAVRRKGTGTLRDLGLTRPRWTDPLLGVGLGVAGLFMAGIILVVLNLIDSSFLPGEREDLARPVDQGGVVAILVLYLVAVVGAPFFEELYFRGLVQGTLRARWGITIALLGQAALFALVHLTPDAGLGNVGIYVVIFAIGVGLGAIRQLSGRLPPGMFTHAAYNAIIVTLAVTGVANT